MRMDLGIGASEFFEKFYEKDIFVKRGAIAKEELPSWHQINQAMDAVDPRSPNIGVFSDSLVPEKEYVEDYVEFGQLRRRVKKFELYRYLRNGATLVVNRFELQCRPIKDLCVQLSSMCGIRSTANAYIAFGGTGTFGKHWDTHDVFAVQLIGRKRWLIYKPTLELPLLDQTSKACKADCPAEPVFDGITEAGDIIYIPRGWWHHALPLEGQETVHVAVGMYPPFLSDYLKWLCSNVLIHHLGCRKSLVLADLTETRIRSVVDTLCNEAVDGENLRKFCEYHKRNDKPSTTFSLERYGSSIFEPMSGRLRLRPASALTSLSDQMVAFAGTSEFTLDQSCFEVLKIIVNRGLITVNEIRDTCDEADKALDMLRALDLIDAS